MTQTYRCMMAVWECFTETRETAWQAAAGGIGCVSCLLFCWSVGWKHTADSAELNSPACRFLLDATRKIVEGLRKSEQLISQIMYEGTTCTVVPQQSVRKVQGNQNQWPNFFIPGRSVETLGIPLFAVFSMGYFFHQQCYFLRTFPNNMPNSTSPYLRPGYHINPN